MIICLILIYPIECKEIKITVSATLTAPGKVFMNSMCIQVKHLHQQHCIPPDE